VRERGDAPPLANADFISTIEGREVTARPLLNDFSPSGRPLRLASVEPSPNLETTVDLDAGTVRVTGGAVGSHYLTYLVADGALPSTGRIRVDIRTPDDEARPVAVRDTALLPGQGSALVDLLANDVDPAGGVLVVQQFTIESAAPVTVELRDRRILSIVDNSLEAPFQLSYTVSNGRFSETGTVEVIPVEPPTQPRPPKAVDDQATVRAGDYATVDVAGNDFSPDGTPFTIERIVETSFASEGEGLAFLSEGADGVGELHARHGPVGADARGDGRERLRLRVVPEAEVVGRDAADRLDRRRLGHHEAGAAARERRQVLTVPVARHAVALLARVLAHRRHPRAVAHLDRPELHGREQHAHRCAPPGTSKSNTPSSKAL
jgi:hypothetical protein